MVVIRIIGWAFFFCAALFLVRDITGGMGADHGFKPKTVADIWNLLSSGGVDDFEGWVLYKYGHTWFMWTQAAFSIWASVACFIPGLIFELIGRPWMDKPYKRVPRKVELKS